MAQTHALPEGIFSLLDTDLYKLTMQSAVLKYFPQTSVTYKFTNRTPQMKLNRAAYAWLDAQVQKLANVALTSEEHDFLKTSCPYLSEQYLRYLTGFRFKPADQVHLSFHPDNDTGNADDVGQLEMHTSGLWLETILYEIPLLALTSEAYFKFIDQDWTYDGQVEQAYEKGLKLLQDGCIFSEFGARRRRDYKAQEMVLQGLIKAQQEATGAGYPGKLSGTSNVHFAMKFGVMPIGTMAHEWFMGVAAVTDSYTSASEAALNYWIGTFGKGVLGIALTDTFGTPTFLKAFSKPVPLATAADRGAATALPSAATTTSQTPMAHVGTIDPPIEAAAAGDATVSGSQERYADVFTATRQDSGDPKEFVKLMRTFYDQQGIKAKKTIVFSDSLNVDRCIELRQAAEEAGFAASFGVGTFFTNDFTRKSDGEKSTPLNIVIKLSSAGGKPAIKISDNLGKNTGDSATVADVKHQLGYVEQEWSGGDERKRWN